VRSLTIHHRTIPRCGDGRSAPAGARAAFTLIELLAVIGILAMLVAMLLPTLAAARRQALSVACQAQLRDIGMHLLMYANANNGWLFPVGLGTNTRREERWPTLVFNPPVYNPPVMLCPADPESVGWHSYILNAHLAEKGIRYGRTGLGMDVSEIVVMGEKVTWRSDYYLEAGEFDSRVELFRHGLRLGSNYLYLDMHVSNAAPEQKPGLLDPWDVPVPLPEPPDEPD
jgi:prepilin-type N-terminal cleavage/methylation domain-containing protein